MLVTKIEAWTAKRWQDMTDAVILAIIGHKGDNTVSLLRPKTYQFSGSFSQSILLWSGAMELDDLKVYVTDADTPNWNIRATAADGRTVDLNVPAQSQDDETREFTMNLRSRFPWKVVGLLGAFVAGVWLVKRRGG